MWVYPGRYTGPASAARSSSTRWRSRTRRAMSVSARFVYSRSAVATWSLRLRPVWNLRAGRAGELGDTALDGGVDVLVGRLERERAVGQLDRDLVERAEDGIGLLRRRRCRRARGRGRGPVSRRDRRPPAGGRSAGSRRRPAARATGRPRTVRARASARGSLMFPRGLRPRTPSACGSLRSLAATACARSSCRHHASDEPCLAAQVSRPRPQRRTNPAESSCRNASAAS